jgi:hypothetical protein
VRILEFEQCYAYLYPQIWISISVITYLSMKEKLIDVVLEDGRVPEVGPPQPMDVKDSNDEPEDYDHNSD